MSLFVGNISRNVKTRDLEEEFDKFGKCTLNSKVEKEIVRSRAATPLWSTRTRKMPKKPVWSSKAKIWVDFRSLSNGARSLAAMTLTPPIVLLGKDNGKGLIGKANRT